MEKEKKKEKKKDTTSGLFRYMSSWIEGK